LTKLLEKGSVRLREVGHLLLIGRSNTLARSIPLKMREKLRMRAKKFEPRRSRFQVLSQRRKEEFHELGDVTAKILSSSHIS
jgi:hypothetical protein